MSNVKSLLNYLFEELDPIQIASQYPSINYAYSYDHVNNNNRVTDDDRVTLSKEQINTSRTYTQPSLNPNKPNGIWYAFGMSWYETVIGGGLDRRTFLGSNPYVYKIDLTAANIKSLNRDNIREFENTYKQEQNTKPTIDWNRVANDFDGIELETDPDSLSNSYPWLRGWDIVSGCIWNAANVTLQRIVSPRQLSNEQEAEQYETQIKAIKSELLDWFENYAIQNSAEAVNKIKDIHEKYFIEPYKQDFYRELSDIFTENLNVYSLETKFEVANIIKNSILYRLSDPQTPGFHYNWFGEKADSIIEEYNTQNNQADINLR